MELGNESERPAAPSLPLPVGTLTQGALTSRDSDTGSSPVGTLTQTVSVNRPLPRPAAPGLFLWRQGEAWRSLGKGAFQEKGSLGSRLRELSCSLSEAPK